MSGICAAWSKDSRLGVAETLASATGGLAMVASDRAGQKTDQGAGVAISAGFPTQQIFENERVLVACDADLCEPRAKAGPSGAAAAIAGLYERFGCRFADQLRGSFSVVLWDRRERKLVAAVDGFGINRLVWFQNGAVLLVASRIDALMRAGGHSCEINPRGIANFLNFGVNLAPETIFRNVHRLAPGTMLVSSAAGTRVERYWDMRYGAGEDAGEERLSRELEEVVQRSVASHCKDDAFTGLGAYLSGGTDSSTVVGMMSRLGRGAVQAFSIGFEDERFNELGYAGITARKFHADHHIYRVTPDDCYTALPHMVRYFDEPFANSSAIPTYFCARLAAQSGVKVLLAGDGGDELFGGNERYRTDKIFELYQSVPRTLRKRVIEPAVERLPLGLASRYVRRSNLPGFERFYSYNFLCAHAPEEVFTSDFLAALDGYSVLEVPGRYYEEAPARDHLDRLLYLDVKITLGDSDLPKVTQMSELAGIQTRFPFLDRGVAEFSGRVPARLKVKGFNKRYLFKRAFRDLLPAEVIRKKKHGFGIPVATWLKTDRRLRELSRDVLFSARAAQRGYFRRSFLDDLVGKHESDDSTYYGDTLWSFLILELWHRQFVDQPLEVAV